ncbi:hypothetical protein [Paraclostridium bifermentans]|uniref:hypothetical protein n=1 Tax=Paraclostridium bifermentans TaxID=1490 RepID=UPI00374F0A2A
MLNVIEIKSEEQLERYNALSKLTEEDIKTMINNNTHLNSLTEYKYLLNCILIDGNDTMLEYIEEILPVGFYSEGSCCFCGHTRVGDRKEEEHLRTKCPVCGQTSDIYLSWEEHREMMDGSIIWFNYFGETTDLIEGLRRLNRDLNTKGRKILNVMPFNRRESCQYKLDYFKENIKPYLSEAVKIVITLNYISKKFPCKEAQDLVEDTLMVMKNSKVKIDNTKPFVVKRIKLDTSKLTKI